MCQGAGVEVHTRSEPGPQTRVAILSVCLIRRIQQIANYMFAICWIRAGHPAEGSELASRDRMSFSVWAYQALVLTYGMTISRTSSGSAQLQTEDVVRLIHQSMFHLDAEELREVNANAEAHQSLQRLKVLPSESMMPCPHERQALTRGQPSATIDWTTLDLGQFWLSLPLVAASTRR